MPDRKLSQLNKASMHAREGLGSFLAHETGTDAHAIFALRSNWANLSAHAQMWSTSWGGAPQYVCGRACVFLCAWQCMRAEDKRENERRGGGSLKKCACACPRGLYARAWVRVSVRACSLLESSSTRVGLVWVCARSGCAISELCRRGLGES